MVDIVTESDTAFCHQCDDQVKVERTLESGGFIRGLGDYLLGVVCLVIGAISWVRIEQLNGFGAFVAAAVAFVILKKLFIKKDKTVVAPWHCSTCGNRSITIGSNRQSSPSNADQEANDESGSGPIAYGDSKILEIDGEYWTDGIAFDSEAAAKNYLDNKK